MKFHKLHQPTLQKHLNFSYSIKQNLSLINQNLQKSLKKYKPSQDDGFSFLNDSQIIDQQNEQQKLLKQKVTLLKDLLENWEQNQIKSMLIYNKLIKRPHQTQKNYNQIFRNTLFHKNLWPLMSYYLQNELKLQIIKTQNSKIIDIWYQFITSENNELFSLIISQNLIQNLNLGLWFKKYCLEQFFMSFFLNDKKLYTNFIKDFFLYGLAYLFYQSVNILKQKCCPLKQNLSKYEKNENINKINKINHIHLNYIERFNL